MHGAFVFRNEGDGCLTSKWINDTANTAYVESCKLLPDENQDGFRGRYRSSWTEDNNITVECDLLIEPHRQNRQLFQLTWRRTGNAGTVLFQGIGMMHGDLMMGSYWERPIQAW